MKKSVQQDNVFKKYQLKTIQCRKHLLKTIKLSFSKDRSVRALAKKDNPEEFHRSSGFLLD